VAQEAQRVLEAARREGTGWVKVDRELVAKVDAALQDAGAALRKAERENSSLYFQVQCLQLSQSVALCMPRDDIRPGMAVGLNKEKVATLRRLASCYVVAPAAHPQGG
jgi:hypothetical protein